MKIKQLPKMDDNNGWLNILPPLPPPASAQGEFQFDFAIVGAGYAGLAVARRLGELLPDCSIVLLDAGRVGNNAAGRSSGFAIDQAHNIRAKDFAGIIDAEREQLSLNRAGQDYLREAVRSHRILCDWDEAGKFHAAATERGASKLNAYAKPWICLARSMIGLTPAS